MVELAGLDCGTDWRVYANCAGADPDLFFADDPAAGKAVCAGCPVTEACLDYAQQSRIRYGTFGGLSETERRRRKRARVPSMQPDDGDERHGTLNGYVNQKCRCELCQQAKAAARLRVVPAPNLR